MAGPDIFSSHMDFLMNKLEFFNWGYSMEGWPGKKFVPAPLYSIDEKKCQIVYLFCHCVSIGSNPPLSSEWPFIEECDM